MNASRGYAFFVMNEKGDFNLKIAIDQENLDPDDLDEDEKVVIKVPLSDKSITAIRALEHISSLERLTGNFGSENSLFELVYWLIEKAAKASFTFGRDIGKKEHAELISEIERLTQGKL